MGRGNLPFFGLLALMIAGTFAQSPIREICIVWFFLFIISVFALLIRGLK